MSWKPRREVARKALAAPEPTPRIDEQAEQAVLAGLAQPGELVMLSQGGNSSRPIALSVHGINGAPEEVQPLIDHAVAEGQTTMTFCYDDRFGRLTDSSKALAEQVSRLIDENPGRPLEFSAHSMGSRVALAALDHLNRQGKLTMPVTLRMVAPTLGGYSSANFATLAPDFIGKLIAGVQPGKDMGSTSQFQRDLEEIRLPENVAVIVFTAGRDEVVEPRGERFDRIIENLGARVVHLPDADHMSAIEQAAQHLRDDTR